MLFAICPLSESDTQLAAEPPPPYGHALMGVRVLKFDGAIAPRVLKFDSGPAAEGCGGRHMDKPLWGLRVDGPLGRRFLRGLSLTRLWRAQRT